MNELKNYFLDLQIISDSMDNGKIYLDIAEICNHIDKFVEKNGQDFLFLKQQYSSKDFKIVTESNLDGTQNFIILKR